MKIRTALTLQNICATATVLAVIFVIISMVSRHARSQAFFGDLKSEAVTKAHLFLEHNMDPATMQNIYGNNSLYINEVEVAIYSTGFDMIYHDAASNDIIHETPRMIDDIITKGVIEFYVGDYQAVGMLFDFEGRKYVLTAAAYDGAGHESQRMLNTALCALFLVGLSLLAVVCYFMAGSSLRPIRNITREAEHITANDIDRRLPVKNPGDELGELSIAINDLLARLESSFVAQRQFVSNVSHELRTPLAAVIAQLDLSLQKERTAEQYRHDIQAALDDAKNINSLITGLLNLAKADYRKESIKMEDIRLDELLLDVRQRILTAHPTYRIDLIFDTFDDDSALDDESLITVHGNIYLLTIALSNLIENNCKYSPDHTSIIHISHWENHTILRFSDNGIGISESDLRNLFTPFYRGEHTAGIEGHGIGMTLAQKIITLHGGCLTVRSHPGEGTTFVVELNHI